MKQLDLDAIANRMRYRANAGQFCGDNSSWERAYVKKCSTREGTTTVMFTRDVGQHEFGWLADPAHDRCLHLSISCVDPIERDAWLRAFFGDNLEHVWGQGHVSEFGASNGVWHWRLFCDNEWKPVITANPGDLLAVGMRRAGELGVAMLRSLAAACRWGIGSRTTARKVAWCSCLRSSCPIRSPTMSEGGGNVRSRPFIEGPEGG